MLCALHIILWTENLKTYHVGRGLEKLCILFITLGTCPVVSVMAWTGATKHERGRTVCRT